MNVHFDPNELGLTHLGMGDRLLTALLGYAVVFAGLMVLMAIVYIMGSIFKAKAAKKTAAAAAAKAAAPAPAPAPAASAAPAAKPAPGTAGEIKLYDVPDKEAAMIMAIVADELKKPLNELRFLSIREITPDKD